MRILHLCLSNFYVDGYSYQENELVRQNVIDGHVVEIIASTETLNAEGDVTYTAPGRYLGADQAMVERVAYRTWLPHAVMKKLRIHPGIFRRIQDFAPDVILFHSACGWEIFSAAKYVKLNPHVKLYVDSHEDFINSARGFISKWVLHFGYYRTILRLNLRYISKLLPVAMSSVEFLQEHYGVPAEKMELYPLGGLIEDDADYERRRIAARASLGILNGQIAIVQSGKIDASKKLVEALRAFVAVPDSQLRFFIVGLLKPDVETAVRPIMAVDTRIEYLGWKTAEELRSVLSAADVYCQPGTQSSTMQMSLSCRCAVILDDITSHKPYFNGNGWLIGNDAGLADVFVQISDNADAVHGMKINAHHVALRMLDYRLLAARIYI
jgi:1,2-diacylglycerol 3-alpha-glucosyltransferase